MLVPVLYTLGEVNSKLVWPVERGDVLQVRRAENSNYAVSTATKYEGFADHQAARR